MYENNPRHLKFIFFFEYFLSMKVSTIIANLEKEKAFYENILVRLDTNTDEKFIVYRKSILDNIETCSKSWKDISKVRSFSKTIKEKTMLDLIKESKDNAKLPYDNKLNFKTPILSDINKEIDEDTFYGPTKDEIFKSLKHEKYGDSSNVTNILNLEIRKANELALSYAEESVIPLDEILESLPKKSFKNIKDQTEHTPEQIASNEIVDTTFTNLEPHNNVDEQQEQIIEQDNLIKHSPLNLHDNQNRFKDLVKNYYKFMFPDSDLCDYQEEFSLESLPVNNSLEELVQPKSTDKLYKNPPPSTSIDERCLFNNDLPPSTSKSQSSSWPTSPSITRNTNLDSYRPMNIPAYNREKDQYYLSDSLSSNASSLSKEHFDENLRKGHREQIKNQTDLSRQNNIFCRRSYSEPVNSIRDRSAKQRHSKNKLLRKRSNSLPCLSGEDKFVKYYNLPHENNYFYDSALGISLDTSYDSTPEDCLFDLYADSDQTERYNAVNLLNTWIDIKNLDPDCDVNVEEDNQTINNDSNDSEKWSETIDKEDDQDDLETQVNISLAEIENLKAKQADESMPHESDIKESDKTMINDQNLNVVKPEDDKNLKNQHQQNENHGSEASTIDESIIQNNSCNSGTPNGILNENCDISTAPSEEKLNNAKVAELNAVKDPKVSFINPYILKESKASIIDDKILKNASVEILDQVDTPVLQLSGTLIETNFENPVSVNKRSHETRPQNQHDLDDSKEKEVHKLKLENANSTNDLIREVTDDVSNQFDMSISKNSEQVKTLPAKSTEKVINVSSNVSKESGVPSSIKIDDSLPSKFSEQLHNSTLKVLEQANDSTLNASKNDDLPSKSSDRIKTLNLNNPNKVSCKASAENINQAKSDNTIDKENNNSSNQNAVKPDEKLKNKPPVIRISFGFSRSNNNFERSRRT